MRIPILTLFSIAAGAVYAVLAIRAAGLLFGEETSGGAERLAAAVLLSGGFVALFFGAAGTVQIAIARGARLHHRESTALPEGRSARSPFPPRSFAAAILSHVSAAYLVPAFVYLLARGVRARRLAKANRSSRRRAVRPLAARPRRSPLR